jgi:hypothetical protein
MVGSASADTPADLGGQGTSSNFENSGWCRSLRGGVEFRVDSGSFSNGDSDKGYEYSLTPPEGHPKTSLDRYRISADDKDRFGNYSVYKPIKDSGICTFC